MNYVAWQLPTDLPSEAFSYVAWRLARLALKGLGLPTDRSPQAPFGNLPTDAANRPKGSLGGTPPARKEEADGEGTGSNARHRARAH